VVADFIRHTHLANCVVTGGKNNLKVCGLAVENRRHARNQRFGFSIPLLSL
jgi:hypothetical protein